MTKARKLNYAFEKLGNKIKVLPARPSLKSKNFYDQFSDYKRKIVYRIMVGTHSIVGVLDVNGLATDASAVDNDIPA